MQRRPLRTEVAFRSEPGQPPRWLHAHLMVFMTPTGGESPYELRDRGNAVAWLNQRPPCWRSSEDGYERAAYEREWLRSERESPAGRLRASLVEIGLRGGQRCMYAMQSLRREVERARALAHFEVDDPPGGPLHRVDFGGGAPSTPKGPMFPHVAAVRRRLTDAAPDLAQPVADLLAALEEMQQHYVFAADCAEFTDAVHNSAQYLRAAGHLDLAAAAAAAIATAVLP